MNYELADHIALIAAPIYAALLRELLSVDGIHAPAAMLADLRRQAIEEALALRHDAVET